MRRSAIKLAPNANNYGPKVASDRAKPASMQVFKEKRLPPNRVSCAFSSPIPGGYTFRVRRVP